MNCYICHRPLRDPETVKHGIGPVCLKRRKADAATVETMIVDLPFDPARRDIVFTKRDDGLHFNLFQSLRLIESERGFLWGIYSGHVVAFALNILNLFCWDADHAADRAPVGLIEGERISRTSYNLADDFAREILQPLPLSGATITAQEVEAWLAQKCAPLFNRDRDRESWTTGTL